MKKKYILLLIFTLMLNCLLLVIPGDTTIVKGAKKVSLNKTSITLPINGSYNLKLDGTTSKITWSSNKKSIATVNKSGKITAKKAGTAIISAKVGKKTYKCKVTVLHFKLNKTTITMTKGKTSQITVSGTKEKITYKSKNKSIATVSKKGKVTGKKKGATSITIKVGKESYSIPVKVETVKLSRSSLSLSTSKTTSLKLSGTSRTAKWYTSNKEVVTVSKKGKLIAISEGTATITAKLNDKSFTCKVTVSKPYTPFEGLPDIITVNLGQTDSFTFLYHENCSYSIADPIYCNVSVVSTTSDSTEAKVILKPQYVGTTYLKLYAKVSNETKVVAIKVVADKTLSVQNPKYAKGFEFTSVDGYAYNDSSSRTMAYLQIVLKKNFSVPITASKIRVYYKIIDSSGNMLTENDDYLVCSNSINSSGTYTMRATMEVPTSSAKKVNKIIITDITADYSSASNVDLSNIQITPSYRDDSITFTNAFSCDYVGTDGCYNTNLQSYQPVMYNNLVASNLTDSTKSFTITWYFYNDEGTVLNTHTTKHNLAANEKDKSFSLTFDSLEPNPKDLLFSKIDFKVNY